MGTGSETRRTPTTNGRKIQLTPLDSHQAGLLPILFDFHFNAMEAS